MEVGELGQIAAIAGQFGIPVIMLSGDEAACAEMRELQPLAVTVAVKWLVGKASSLSLSHEEAKRQIREAARKAVAHAEEYPPWKVSGPVEMVIEYLPQPPLQSARTVSYKNLPGCAKTGLWTLCRSIWP
jgi:D-amino peptidase